MKKTSWRKILRVTQLFILAFVIVASYTSTNAYAQGSLTVSGTVTSGGTNEIGVNVYAYTPGTASVVASTTTSSSGTYTIMVNPGTYDFRYVPPSSINLNKLVVKNVPITGNTTLDEQLNSDQNTFSGTISDQNGNPLPSVNIKLTDIYGDIYSSSSANDGAFSVNAEPGQYALILSGRLMGTYNTGSYQDGSYTITQQSNGIDLSNGNVTQNLVLPIANVTASLYNAGYYLETNSPYIRATASGGSTSLYGGDSGELITESINSGNNIPTGSHTFQVLIGSTFSTATGSSICGYDHTSTLLGCLPSATTITGDVSVSIPNTPPAKNTFSGKLTDQNGKALVGVAMSLNNFYGNASTTTDNDGHFTLSLEPGSYALSLSGSLIGTYPNGLHIQDGTYTITQQSNAIDLSNGNVVQNLVLPIANVTTTVYAGYYPATSPTPYIRAIPSSVSASLYDGDPGGLITENIRTGNNIPDGTHTFQVLIGSTFSTTEGSSICGYNSNIGNDATYGCIPLATTITGDVSLSIPNTPTPPAKNTFSGKLTDQNGKALPSVSMSLKNDYSSASTRTDTNGNFSLSLEPGSYTLSLIGSLWGTYPNGHYQDGSYTITQQSNAIDLSNGNVVQNLVLPIANVTVSVYTPGGTSASYPYIRATANGGSTSLYSGDSGELITEYINTGNNIPSGIHTFQMLTGSTFSTTVGSSICGYNGSTLYGCLPAATTITGDVNLSVPDSPIPSAPSGLSAQSPTNQTPVLVWNAVNNITVDHYDVYRDGNKVGSTTNITYSDMGMSEGNHTYYVVAVSNMGVSSSPSNSVMVVYDTTPPTINYSLSPAPNANGWYNVPVTITFNCSDALSSVGSCTSPITLTDNGIHTVTGTAIDKVGNITTTTVTVKIDSTPPTITISTSSNPNGDGWHNGDVTVTFTCSDNLSGVDFCPSPIILHEGANQTATGTATDKTGNTASVSLNMSVDETPPTIHYSLRLAPNSNGWNNSQVVVTFSCDDALSGVASCTDPVTSTSDGTYIVIGTAVDKAGNITSVNVIVSVDQTAPTITSNPTFAPNASGWYNSDTTVSFTCDDSLSGVDTCTYPITLSDGENQIVTGTVVDKAGNSESTSTSISVDKTAPTISYGLSKQPNTNGWNSSDVTVTFGCSDALSGVATCTNPVTLTEDGTYVVTGTAIDNAGNVTSINMIVKIDKMAPTTGDPLWSVNPSPLGSNTTLSVPATDSGSGIASGEYFIGNDPGVGSGTPTILNGAGLYATFGANLPTGYYTIGVRLRDVAGNWSGITYAYLIIYNPNGPTEISGSKGFVPSLANGDILPGLINVTQNYKATMNFNVVYDTDGTVSGISYFNFSYNTGQFCNSSHPLDCFSTGMTTISINSLTFVGTNDSEGIFEGVGALTINGILQQVIFKVEATDGMAIGNHIPDTFTMQIYSAGVNPDEPNATPIYQVTTSLTGNGVVVS